MSLFWPFTVKIETTQNDKVIFLRQTSFYKVRYLIFDIETQHDSVQYTLFEK